MAKNTIISDYNPETDWLKAVDYRERNAPWLQISAEIAAHILELLDEKGWSKAELARELNVSPQQVSKIISGGANMRLSTIAALQKALGVKLITTRFAYPWKQHVQPEFESAGFVNDYQKVRLALEITTSSVTWIHSQGSFYTHSGIHKENIIQFTNKIRSVRAKSKPHILQYHRDYD